MKKEVEEKLVNKESENTNLEKEKESLKCEIKSI